MDQLMMSDGVRGSRGNECQSRGERIASSQKQNDEAFNDPQTYVHQCLWCGFRYWLHIHLRPLVNNAQASVHHRWMKPIHHLKGTQDQENHSYRTHTDCWDPTSRGYFIQLKTNVTDIMKRAIPLWTLQMST